MVLGPITKKQALINRLILLLIMKMVSGLEVAMVGWVIEIFGRMKYGGKNNSDIINFYNQLN